MENWTPVQRILAGQLLLIVCCAVYLIWWSVSFRPGQSVNRAGGYRGVLLLFTAVCGVVGAILTISGVNGVPSSSERWNGMAICLTGLCGYAALLFFTGSILHRPVTTELVLIVGWTVMEFCAVNALAGAGILSGGRMAVMSGLIAAACIVSMVLYVLYYRMEAWRAFYFAMVPLATEGISMAVLEILSIPGFRAL
jgi:hypothetical protein